MLGAGAPTGRGALGLEPVADGTRLTLSNEGALGGWMKPFQPLLERNVQGMFERDVARLKAVIEADLASPTSPAPSPG